MGKAGRAQGKGQTRADTSGRDKANTAKATQEGAKHGAHPAGMSRTSLGRQSRLLPKKRLAAGNES